MQKIVLVTGASKGIGVTLCKFLIEKNYKVIGVYNNTIIDNELIDSYKCDISDEKQIQDLFKYIKNKYNKIDILINCAAISLDSNFYEKTKEEFMKVLEVNLVGTFLMCKYASLIMNEGVIVNVTSTNGDNTYTELSIDYDASKAGLNNMTKSLSMILSNIKVCALMPNWVDTDTTLSIDNDYLKKEMKRIGQTKLIKKESVAKKIIEIIENDSIKSGSIIRMEDGNE